MDRDQLQRDAWLGDAVLTLWARQHILESGGAVDGEKCRRLTSNQFLSSVGEPTLLEAELGRVYQAQGLEAAFQWIRLRLMPMFHLQEEKRARIKRR